MELKILSYNNKQKRNIRVKSKYGEFNVIWDGELPVIGAEVDVELDIDKNLTWNTDISLATNNTLQIRQIQDDIVIQGKLEETDSDGFTVLRLNNSIITFITEGKAFPINSIIQIKILKIKAYPTDY
ncbi:hypothetical protein M2475_001836 [Breznakia sp. PF5-3]|uniref:hypothetical protein n=1 Tax=unclassified Breznakia TaxID=2623764 RepID=UPI00240556BE|nr:MULTISPECIES: hypothetical protein [unclassified Breznakia]MDF9825381.1 hypothetical protein [Breznakia sp. PM6-1]MDF9836259.1 hypothetical protein [Breznakia sp. PF5-3]MDF9838980.1 hypothetical protein [Breznakia sp. PFB2-8]MDF9860504.1 hypothetical protein [Breznakia sp. PH5-24]